MSKIDTLELELDVALFGEAFTDRTGRRIDPRRVVVEVDDAGIVARIFDHLTGEALQRATSAVKATLAGIDPLVERYARTFPPMTTAEVERMLGLAAGAGLEVASTDSPLADLEAAIAAREAAGNGR